MKKAQESHISILDLPQETLVHIFRNWFQSTGYDFQQLIKTGHTCRAIWQLLRDNAFWKYAYPYTHKYESKPSLNYYQLSINRSESNHPPSRRKHLKPPYMRYILHNTISRRHLHDPDRLLSYIQEKPSKRYNVLSEVPGSLRSNENFVLEVLKCNRNAIQYTAPYITDELHAQLCESREMQPYIMKYFEFNWQDVTSAWKDDPKFIADIISVTRSLETLPSSLPMTLLYAACKFITNAEATIMLICNSHQNFEEMISLSRFSKTIQQNRNVVLKAVEVCGDNLHHADTAFFDDREIVLNAVSNNNWHENTDVLLKSVSNRLTNDSEVAFEAVSTRPASYEFVSKRLLKDRELLELAMTFAPTSFSYADKKLQEDKDFVLTMFDEYPYLRGGWFFESLSKKLQTDSDIIGQQEIMPFSII